MTATAGRERPAATVSVDVDPVDLHLIGYGHSGLAADPLVYDVALPRLAERFARHGIRATLFVVGRDAAGEAAALRALASAGHEVASHSSTHPLALSSLPAERQREEFEASRAALEAASGRPVVGFRAPNFDMDAATLARLAAAGYRYDASGYPSPVLALARLVLAARSRSPGAVLGLKLLPFSWRRTPHAIAAGPSRLAEFPLTVDGPLRWPVYHTLRYGQSDAHFAATLDRLAAAGRPLSYALHAVDALGLAEDRVDGRLAKHPGMDRPLAAKLDLLDRSLAAIAGRFRPATFAERVSAGEVPLA